MCFYAFPHFNRGFNGSFHIYGVRRGKSKEVIFFPTKYLLLRAGECVFIARIICCLRIEWSCRPASHATDTRSGGSDNAISQSCNSAIAAHFGKLMSGRLALAELIIPDYFPPVTAGAQPRSLQPPIKLLSSLPADLLFTKVRLIFVCKVFDIFSVESLFM